MVLTTREDCLNCGAYEAVSALKPGLLSDKKALRQYFDKGFVYTDNSIDDIKSKITLLASDVESLSQQIQTLKDEIEIKSAQDIDKLERHAALLSRY